MNASFKGRGAIAGRAVGRLLLAVLAVLVVLAACVAINTWRHGSRQLEVAPVQPVAVDGAAAAAHLAEAARCPARPMPS
jgi:carboxypeptidase PM20D1